MKNKNLTCFYSAVQLFYWMCFAPIMGFVSLYLLSLGFTSSTIGVLIAISGAISAVLQPLVSGYADRPDSISLKWLNIFIGGLTLGCAVGLLLCQNSRVMTLILFGLAIALLQLATPLVNAMGMNSLNCGSPLNFGVAKAAGSLGYAGVSTVLGRLVERFGSTAVPTAMVALYMLFLASVLVYPRQKLVTEHHAVEGIGFTAFFKKYPRFGMVVVGCVCIFISHVLLNSFTLQIIETKGGGSGEMGIAMGLAAVTELPTAIAFSYMLRKAGSHVWFRLAGVFFTLKILGTLLCTNMTGFYLVQPLQMFAWALIAVSAVYYINSIMEPEDAVKGQGYYSMSYTVGSVLGAVIGGKIIDSAGIPAMLIFGTVCAVLGTLLIAGFAEKTNDRVAA